MNECAIRLKSIRKRLALVANSAWSVYNFRIDLIRHLLLRFDVLIIAPRDAFVSELEKAGCTYLEIHFNNRSENPLRDYMLYRSLKKIYLSGKARFHFSLCYKTQYLRIAGGLPAVAFIP